MTCNLQKINHSHALAQRLVLNFSITFTGIVWNIVALPVRNILFVETRDEMRRKVDFSALQYDSGTFLWKDKQLPEPWWVGLLAASDRTLLVQRYNPDNPDKPTVIALDIETARIQWTKVDFTFHKLFPTYVSGFDGTDDHNLVSLDLKSGERVRPGMAKDLDEHEINAPLCPFQYQEGTPFLATVRDYLLRHFNHRPEGPAEYLEFGGKVVISYHIRTENGLANYLVVIGESGSLLLNEKMEEGSKGLGADTFFILSGCLFFVRNKKELLSYQLL
jgi:Domain of unknown function (DUF4905)